MTRQLGEAARGQTVSRTLQTQAAVTGQPILKTKAIGGIGIANLRAEDHRNKSLAMLESNGPGKSVRLARVNLQRIPMEMRLNGNHRPLQITTGKCVTTTVREESEKLFGEASFIR